MTPDDDDDNNDNDDEGEREREPVLFTWCKLDQEIETTDFDWVLQFECLSGVTDDSVLTA